MKKNSFTTSPKVNGLSNRRGSTSAEATSEGGGDTFNFLNKDPTKLKAKRLARSPKVILLPIQRVKAGGDAFNCLNKDLIKLKAKRLARPPKVNLPPIQRAKAGATLLIV
jgi:hypothetical protein